jgi:hypothetical protein
VVEEDLEALADPAETLEGLARRAGWGTLQAFRSALTVERVTHADQGTVYAFRAQRVLSEAFQYKPLLKVLESPGRRHLIADEVGLGKTVEAGLILTELEARQPLDRVLVVCLSRLREKWRDELGRKFDMDFEIAAPAGPGSGRWCRCTPSATRTCGSSPWPRSTSPAGRGRGPPRLQPVRPDGRDAPRPVRGNRGRAAADDL